jgi:hypothetical protein
MNMIKLLIKLLKKLKKKKKLLKLKMKLKGLPLLIMHFVVKVTSLFIKRRFLDKYI